MKLKKETFTMLAATLATAGMANAHIIALGWDSLGGGVVEFSVLHWHGNNPADGVLIFDGVSYPFTSVTWDTPSLSGFDGALVNSDYAVFSNGTITAVDTGFGLEDNWMHVTITGIGPGTHTVTAPDHPEGLTDWTLDGDISTFDFDFTGGDGNTVGLVSSTLRMTSVGVARTVTRDVGSRLFRMRAGRPQAVQPMVAPPHDPGPKGGMAKSPKSPIMMPAEMKRWEVYGSIFFHSDEQDQQVVNLRNANGALFQALVHPDTSVDTFGGNAGFEYRFNDRWSAGFAIGAATTDVDMATVGSADIDTLALIPYVSYYQTGVFAGADLYADLMYAYGMNEYDTLRFTGGGLASGSPDGDFHQLEVNTGLNFRSGSLVHGPFASLRWLDGSIDSHVETGPGAALVPSADYESLATNLGYQVSYPVQVGGGVVVPQGRVAWEHEFEDDMGSTFGIPGGVMDEDLAVLGAGIGYYMSSGWNVVLDYEARLGSDNESHFVGLKAGYEF